MNRTGAGAERPARQILIVEDEALIGMLLEDMLGDLGYQVAATATRVDEATKLAHSTEVDAAILDVNLNGEPVQPVADVLTSRGVPFIFATGYGERGVPEPYRGHPTLQKPFQIDDLARLLQALFETTAGQANAD